MLDQSKMIIPNNPMDRFDQELEWGKLVTTSPLYISEHRDEIKKSMDGEYDEVRRLIGGKKPRGSERLDITWAGSDNVQDVYDRAFWYAVRLRIINLKVCCDGYALSKGDIKKFYEDLYQRIPNGQIKLPNGKKEHPFEIMRLARNLVAHDGSEEKEKDKAKRLDLGMSDIYEFLMTPYRYVDDGEDVKMVSYDTNS